MGERKACPKTGRNARSPSRRRYWATHREQVHRESRIKRHIAANPNDLQAPHDLRRIEDEPIRHIVGPGDYSLPGTPKKKE